MVIIAYGAFCLVVGVLLDRALMRDRFERPTPPERGPR
jgi:hypothetical protein